MLRLWCELCVIVCPCFLDDPAERGPYLNTRKNKDSLQSNNTVSNALDDVCFFFFSQRCVLDYFFPSVACGACVGSSWHTLMCCSLIHILVRFSSLCTLFKRASGAFEEVIAECRNIFLPALLLCFVRHPLKWTDNYDKYLSSLQIRSSKTIGGLLENQYIFKGCKYSDLLMVKCTKAEYLCS